MCAEEHTHTHNLYQTWKTSALVSWLVDDGLIGLDLALASRNIWLTFPSRSWIRRECVWCLACLTWTFLGIQSHLQICDLSIACAQLQLDSQSQGYLAWSMRVSSLGMEFFLADNCSRHRIWKKTQAAQAHYCRFSWRVGRWSEIWSDMSPRCLLPRMIRTAVQIHRTWSLKRIETSFKPQERWLDCDRRLRDPYPHDERCCTPCGAKSLQDLSTIRATIQS